MKNAQNVDYITIFEQRDEHEEKFLQLVMASLQRIWSNAQKIEIIPPRNINLKNLKKCMVALANDIYLNFNNQLNIRFNIENIAPH